MSVMVDPNATNTDGGTDLTIPLIPRTDVGAIQQALGAPLGPGAGGGLGGFGGGGFGGGFGGGGAGGALGGGGGGGAAGGLGALAGLAGLGALAAGLSEDDEEAGLASPFAP
jgi:hypothetical protein